METVYSRLPLDLDHEIEAGAALDREARKKPSRRKNVYLRAACSVQRAASPKLYHVYVAQSSLHHVVPPELFTAKMLQATLLAALAATAAFACDSCYGPVNPDVHTRLSRRMQPDALTPLSIPKHLSLGAS